MEQLEDARPNSPEKQARHDAGVEKDKNWRADQLLGGHADGRSHEIDIIR